MIPAFPATIAPPSDDSVSAAQNLWVRNSPGVLLVSIVLQALTLLIYAAHLGGSEANAFLAWTQALSTAGFFASMVTLFGFYNRAVRKLWLPRLETAKDDDLVRMRESKTLCGRDQEILEGWIAEKRPALVHAKVAMSASLEAATEEFDPENSNRAGPTDQALLR